MGAIAVKMNQYLEVAAETYRIPRRWIVAIIIFPILIDSIALVFLRLGTTKKAAKWMLDENHPVELLTFLFLMMAAGWALILARRAKRNHENIWVYGFYFLFSVALLLVAMEEISWGQQFFKFKTFGVFKEINMQGEVNLHNIGDLQGNSAYFRIFFGLSGLLGLWLSRFIWWRKITPPTILLTWFLVITFFAALGIMKNLTGYTRLYYAFSLRDLSELNEMLIGLSSFLFIWLNMRKLQFEQAMKSSATKLGA